MTNETQDKKINFTSVEIINLLGELNLTPKESLIVITKVMHFIIEKGFCQSEAKTMELISEAIGTLTLTTTVCHN